MLQPRPVTLFYVARIVRKDSMTNALLQGKRVPYFRSVQWNWFAAAMVYCYGELALRCALRHDDPALIGWRKTQKQFAFAFYSYVFMMTVLVHSFCSCYRPAGFADRLKLCYRRQ